LFQERIHFLAQIGYLNMRPLPPEQIAAEFAFELLDRTG
jgi:hypothetical protein